MFVSERKLKIQKTIAIAVCILAAAIWILSFLTGIISVFVIRDITDEKDFTEIICFICLIIFIKAFDRYTYLHKTEVLEKFILLHIEEKLTVHRAAVFMKMSDESFVKYFRKLVSKGYIINLGIININGFDEIVPSLKIPSEVTEYTYIECSECGLKNKIQKGSDAKCTFCKANLDS
ncbi:MAG: hypothetical protein E7508_00075 [Ruminococcus sp.]|nr:hypothetical protein [Ruminococcus sp.]